MSASASPRTNQAWVAELRGANGQQQQTAAHRDLANYLYIVAYNYLRHRQAANDLTLLRTYAAEELAALAQDFVQEFLLKLIKDDYVLLTHFTSSGNFTSWCARVLTNLIADEFRHVYWHRQELSQEDDKLITAMTPERMLQIEQVDAIIHHCLAQLDARRRFAFEQCIIENKRAKEVAPLLQTTENGLNQLVYRARHALQECMEKHGINADALALFIREE